MHTRQKAFILPEILQYFFNQKPIFDTLQQIRNRRSVLKRI